MRQHLLKLLLSLLTAASFFGCGSPGAPLPPSLNLPRPVSDLRAVRKGNRVRLAWTVSAETTDRQRLREVIRTKICREVQTVISDCEHPLAEVSSSRPTTKTTKKGSTAKTAVQANYEDLIPESLQAENPLAHIVYAVSVSNERGKSAGVSNQVSIPAAPTLPPPANFISQVTADGVLLSWANPDRRAVQGLAYKCRFYRRAQGGDTDIVVGELPLDNAGPTQFLDKNFEWEKKYSYRATIVTSVNAGGANSTEVEGEDTSPVEVFAHDIFPPAVPSGLEAVFTATAQQSFMDLIWTPDTEADLAGYNVYRKREGEEEVKLNSELVKAPSFRDSAILSGKKYFYYVSAVDVRGNESRRSEEASESVP
jgi:predicted phage tail protein